MTILTILPLLLWFALTLPGCRKEIGYGICSKSTSLSLKGLCAIVIIYVHVPSTCGNDLQDAVGSFAFICVTLFFFYSAYGMALKVDENNDYLRHFWRNRVSKLLIPCLLVDLTSFLVNLAVSGRPDVGILYSIDPYVIVLLEWCLVFYVVERLRRRFGWSRGLTDCILIILVLLPSLSYYFIYESNGLKAWWGLWHYEKMGLIWGLLACRYKENFSGWISRNRIWKIVVFLLFALIVGIAYVKLKPVFFWGAYALKVLLGLSSLLLLSLVVYNFRIESAFSAFLGKISYEVYLCQFMVLATLQNLIPQFNSGQFVAVSIFMTVMVGAAVNKLSSNIIPLIRHELEFHHK